MDQDGYEWVILSTEWKGPRHWHKLTQNERIEVRDAYLAKLDAWVLQAKEGFVISNDIADDKQVIVFSTGGGLYRGMMYLVDLVDDIDSDQLGWQLSSADLADLESGGLVNLEGKKLVIRRKISSFASCQNTLGGYEEDETPIQVDRCGSEMIPKKNWSSFNGPILRVHWGCMKCWQREGREYDVRPGHPCPSEDWITNPGDPLRSA